MHLLIVPCILNDNSFFRAAARKDGSERKLSHEGRKSKIKRTGVQEGKLTRGHKITRSRGKVTMARENYL